MAIEILAIKRERNLEIAREVCILKIKFKKNPVRNILVLKLLKTIVITRMSRNEEKQDLVLL